MYLRPSPAVLLMMLIIASCARMVAPGGGPEDLTPPELISIEPETGPDNPGIEEIVLTFSERLNPATVEIPMYPSLEHRIRNSGSRIRIELAEPLGNRTVVLHVPSTITDQRGNRLESARDLVFSGADSLGSSSLMLNLSRQGGGTLFMGQLLVELYDTDSILIRRSEPDSTGTASILWLDHGSYRILCYEDRDLSFTWEAETEAGKDTTVALAEGEELILAPVLTVVDTLGPTLVDVQPLDSWHIRVLFGEEVSRASLSDAVFTLTDASSDTIGINGWWITGGGRGLNGPVLSTARDTGDSTLMLRITGVADLLGNVAEPDSMEIWGLDSLPADSLRIAGIYPEPGGEDIPAGGPFSIGFSYLVTLQDVEPIFTLTKVSDSTRVEGKLVQVTGRAFEFTPTHQLMGGEQYRLDLQPGLTTAWGDTLEAYAWAFTPAWGNEPGAVSGRIGGVPSPVIVQISHAGESGEPLFLSAGPGAYEFIDLAAGRYTVAAFVDRNGDGLWQPGEPYGAFPGMITVYPGLTTEEVDIEILP